MSYIHRNCVSSSLIENPCTRNKAVAEGAIIFKVDHAVSSRVARYTYGIRACEDFDPTRPDHLARESTCIEAPSGEILIPHCFSAILQKVNFTPACSPAADVFNRVLRLQRRRSSEKHIPSSFQVLHSTVCKLGLSRSNATETVRIILLLGSMKTQVRNAKPS